MCVFLSDCPIRPAKTSDAESIAAIYNRYITRSTATFEVDTLSVAEMEARIRAIAASHPYYIYEAEGRVAGYCYAHPWKERAAYAHTWETTVYVAPEQRGHGIGSQLMRRLIADCRERGLCRSLIACITGNNEASIAMHERLGFERVSHFKKVGYKFGQWLDIVDYQLELCPPL